MRKGIALFCTVFMLLSSGYAQSNRVGVYATPQYVFFKTGTLFEEEREKGKGFAFNGGVYYGKQWDVVGFSVGLGYSQLNTTISGVTHKTGFVSVPINGHYDYDITDNFFIGTQVTAAFCVPISEKQVVDGVETSLDAAKKLHLQYGLGLSFTYLFSDNLGISVLPTFSLLATDRDMIFLCWGAGAQIRIFYAFGY